MTATLLCILASPFAWLLTRWLVKRAAGTFQGEP